VISKELQKNQILFDKNTSKPFGIEAKLEEVLSCRQDKVNNLIHQFNTLVIKNNNFANPTYYLATEYINWGAVEDFIDVSDNAGYLKTFSAGVDSINSGDTTVTINHELSNVENPQRIIIQ
jgi:hypothetical protein